MLCISEIWKILFPINASSLQNLLIFEFLYLSFFLEFYKKVNSNFVFSSFYLLIFLEGTAALLHSSNAEFLNQSFSTNFTLNDSDVIPPSPTIELNYALHRNFF